MDKSEAMEKLKEELDKIPTLREEHYDNQDFKLWRHKVETIIKAALDPDDLKTFSSARPSSFPMRGVATENSFKEHYQKELTSYETALKSIIQKYEMLGVEGERDKGGEVKKMDKKQKTIIDEMDEFRTMLIGFTVLRKKLVMEGQNLTSEEDELFSSLFDTLSIDAGKYGPLIREITGLEIIHTGVGPQDIWNWALSTSANTLVIHALDNCVAATSRTIGTLKKDIANGLRDKKTGHLISMPTIKNIETIRAFIAHEGESRALTMLKEFLEALGIRYFIAESKASNGRSIERQVDWTQSKADFAIFLTTKGKAINRKTGKHYMAPNIADELGRARQVFGNKIILLVQKGVELHTNIREIVYETFTTTNMEKAFIKVARELTNWGFIKVGTIRE